MIRDVFFLFLSQDFVIHLLFVSMMGFAFVAGLISMVRGLRKWT